MLWKETTGIWIASGQQTLSLENIWRPLHPTPNIVFFFLRWLHEKKKKKKRERDINLMSKAGKVPSLKTIYIRKKGVVCLLFTNSDVLSMSAAPCRDISCWLGGGHQFPCPPSNLSMLDVLEGICTYTLYI